MKLETCRVFFVPLQPNFIEYRYRYSLMRFKFFYLLGLLAFFFSCTQEQEVSTTTQETTVDRGNRIPVKFYNSDISISTSRATGEAFDLGDAIGICVVNKGETLTDQLQESDNYADNLEYVLGTDGFEPVTDSIWQYDKMKLDLVYYAVYPYMKNLKPIFTFSALADQSTHNNYTQSDLSCQKKESKESNISLELKHMMSKIVVRLQGHNNMNIEDSALSVSLTNMYLDANVNLNTMEVTATGEAAPSIKCEEDTTLTTSTERVFQAIIAPQTLTTTSTLIITTETNSCTIPVPRACRLTSGKQWTLSYDISIDEDGNIYVRLGDDEEDGQHDDSRQAN